MTLFSKTVSYLAIASTTVLIIFSCKKSLHEPAPNALERSVSVTAATTSVAFSEDFEVGTTSPKTAYDVAPAGSSAGDDVTLHGRSWNLYDALIGNLAGDLKSGSWSARVRNSGKITMLFDVTTGITSVTVKHGTYGSDAASQWGLFYSVNGGSTWAQSGSNVTTTGTLQTQTFNLNLSGNVRLEIRKLSGGSARINIDDIVVNTGGGGGGGITGKKFLFDASKRQNAGSADWQIDADGTEYVPIYTGGTTQETMAQRFPTPSYTGITAGTPETYWRGATSAWAIELVKRGHYVETLPRGAQITYGDASNPQDLSNYDVFLLIEPNNLYTASEKTAIMNFVTNGGGLMLIADHTGQNMAGKDANGYNPSDRDGDGYDSPRIINDLMTNNGVNNNNPFGFRADSIDISESPSSKVYTGTNTNAQAVLNGIAGTANKLADRKSTRLNSSHERLSRMPSSA